MTIAGQGGCWKKEEDKEQDGCMAGRMLDRTDRTGQRHDRCRCKTGRMQYRSVAGVDVCRTGWMQERTDSVQGRYRKSQMPDRNTHYRNIQMQDRKDTEHIPGQKIISKQDGCSTGRPLKRTNSGQDRCRTDEKKDRSNAGKEIYCTLQDGCKTC